jgi:hypothetical protein
MLHVGTGRAYARMRAHAPCVLHRFVGLGHEKSNAPQHGIPLTDCVITGVASQAAIPAVLSAAHGMGMLLQQYMFVATMVVECTAFAPFAPTT